jgi:hypothetical protein
MTCVATSSPTRVEFRLSMTNSPSWNGRWSGEDKNYVVWRELDTNALKKLLWDDTNNEFFIERTWFHRWSDGWCAGIKARIVPVGEELPRSDGFHGYEWMVDNLLKRGTPYGEVTS